LDPKIPFKLSCQFQRLRCLGYRASILPLVAMLTKEREMLQPDALCEHTMQQNATAARTPRRTQLVNLHVTLPQTLWLVLSGPLAAEKKIVKLVPPDVRCHHVRSLLLRGGRGKGEG